MNAMHKKNKIAVAVSCAYVSLVLSPAYASDTEIYTQEASNKSESPVVMMMLDTSGSMGWCMDPLDLNAPESTANCKDPTRRKDALVAAVKAVLNGSTTTTPVTVKASGKVKMGLATYQTVGNGGLIRYPARPLDALANINPNGDASSTGVSSSALTISSTAVGLYFPDVQMPRNATITSAKITFKAKANSTVATTKWNVGIEDIGNANSSFTSLPLSSRTFIKPSTAPAEIEVPYWSANSTYDVEVTNFVQSIANKATWCGGNGMAFKLNDALGNMRDASGVQAILTVNMTIDKSVATCTDVNYVTNYVLGGVANSDTADSTRLSLDDVEWPNGASNATGVLPTGTTLSPNLIASGKKRQVTVRLTPGNSPVVPAGAVIKSALLKFTPSTTITTAQPISIDIYNNANLPIFCSSATTCTAPTSALKGSPVVLTDTIYTKDQQKTVDVTSMLQSLSSTSALSVVGFLLQNNGTTSASTNIYSGNNGSANAPSILSNEATRRVSLTIQWTQKNVTNISALKTVREELTSIIDGLTFTSSTPLGAAFVETSRYLYGLTPYYAVPTFAPPNAAAYDALNNKYISPLTNASSCSNNYVFMLTDGAPTKLAGVIANTAGTAAATVASITQKALDADGYCSTAGIEDDNPDTAMIETVIPRADIKAYPEEANAETGSKAATWLCSLHIADINKNPAKRTVAGNTINSIVAPIKTSTVILGPEGDDSEVEMKRVARVGGGVYTKASNTQELVNALNDVLNKALEGENVLAAPGVAINQFNRLNTLDQVYYVLFSPTKSKRWDGNLKRYSLDLSNQDIKDVNGVSAITADGAFEKTSKSYWLSSTDAVDGASVVTGGAASKLPLPSVRKIYSYTGALPQTGVLSLLDPTVAATRAWFGSESAAAVTDLINWYKGYDIAVGGSAATASQSVSSATARQKLAGGLHSKAVLVNYGFSGTGADALDISKQANMLYYSTLDSMLHGINASTGVEEFAFIPSQKLGAIRTLYNNATASPPEPEYGMDLTWTVYRKDANTDGQIDSASDKVYLYGGMRMGGRNYYGLDVSTVSPKKCPATSTTPCITPAPKMLFSIIGGSTAGFERLGQTWSQPVVADVKVNGVVTPVLIFGGGYDSRYEDCYYETSCNAGSTPLGNALYIVNAVTGAKIWSASSSAGADSVISSMTYSMPSHPKVLDANSDGLADTIYIGDLGGQVFRVDIDNKNAIATGGTTLVKRVRLLAQLGSTGVATPTTLDGRRIYEPPTVAFFKDAALNRNFAAVAIGTGNRSHPLSTTPLIKDRFATIFDFDVTRTDLLTAADASLQSTVKYAHLKEITGLEDVGSNTSGAITYTTNTTTGVITPDKLGWYVELFSTGEKSLATGLIYLNKLLFTTYSPSATATGCTVSVGSSNLYELCMPYGTQCADSTLSGTARRQANYVTGLGAEPQVVVQPTGVLADGTPAPENDLGVLIKTKLKKKQSGGKKVLTPLHHWREKTRYPAK